MNRFIVPVFILIVGIIGFFILQKNSKSVHFHAGFQIYIDGKLQDFSDSKYMSLVPCSNDGHQIATKDRVHLHDGVDNVIHVHQAHVVWNDIVTYLKLSTANKSIEGFVNNKKVDDILNTEIEPYDSAIILIGSHGDIKNYLDKALKKSYIQDVETRNGLCKG